MAKKMNNNKVMCSLEKELNILTENLKKLSKNNEELRKIIIRQDQFIDKKKAQRKVSYIDWLSNERRMNSLISD